MCRLLSFMYLKEWLKKQLSEVRHSDEMRVV